MTESSKKWLNFRFLALLLAVLAAFGYAVVSLAKVQLGNTEFYRKKVAAQLSFEGTLPAERGRIFDSDGEELAVNVTKYRIFISPGDMALMSREARKAKENGEKYAEEKLDTAAFAARELAEITGIPYEEILELTKDTSRYDVTLVEEADRELAEQVTALKEKYSLGYTVNVESFSKRTYLYGSLAAQTIGFVAADGTGAYGLEAYYNDVLSGTDGKYTALTDSRNRVISDEYSSYVAPQNGNELHLTLNRRVQEILEEQVKAAADACNCINGAFGVVMNAKNGAVLGIANYPDYDLNNPRELTGMYVDRLVASAAQLGYAEGTKEYDALLGQNQMEMWRNRTVSFPYVPGSTFKVITTGIALETGSVKLTDTYTCTGSILSVDHVHRIRCSNHYGHGTLTFAQGLQQSCNPWFITAGLKIGTALFWDSMENIGYFRLTGIDLPSESETIFWPRSQYTQADLETSAFGQNFKVTAIRHLTSLSAIANDGVAVQPHLVESVTDTAGNVVWQYSAENTAQVFSKEITDTVASVLAEGVAGNGGSSNAYVAGYKVAAKTGTSEKMGDVDEYNKICSCMAFAPYDDPEIIMIIVVDSPEDNVNSFGNTVVAPYVSKALSEILPYLGVATDYTPEEQKKLNVTVGDYVGKTLSAARTLIENKELDVVVRGSGTTVTAQMPASGTQLSKDGGQVVLYLGDTAPERTVTVPDFRGMPAQDAKNAVLRLGLNLEETGMTNYGNQSVVISQSAAPGTLLIPGEMISLEFRCLGEADD